MRFQMKDHVMRIAQFGNRVYNIPMNFENPEETALRGIEAHESFLREIGMPITLKELGAKTEDIEKMAKKTKKNFNGEKTGRAWHLDVEDIIEILKIADR